MNLFQAMRSRTKHSAIDGERLPALNSFVDVATGGKTESLPIEDIGRTSFDVRRPCLAAVGTKALFNYSNGHGRFRFYAECSALEKLVATYALPTEITVIEEFGNKRRNYRLKFALAVDWRYAPDGVGYGEYTRGATVDVSCAGVSLVVPRELRVGTQIELRLELAGNKPFQLVGTLTRPTQKQPSGKFLAGLCFQNISPTSSNAISEFIATRQKGQSKRSMAEEH